MGNRPSALGDTTLHRLAYPSAHLRTLDYAIAVAAAVLSLAARAALDALVHNDQLFVLGLLAVVFVSWRSGFGPGLVTLVLNMAGMLVFFRRPELPEHEGIGYLIAAGMFLCCGVCCAWLGEAQRVARRRTKDALAVALDRKADLEVEVARRRETEAVLKRREGELTEANSKLADDIHERERTTDSLRETEERFRSMADSMPVLIWVTDNTPARTYFNRTWLEFTGRTREQELGSGWRANVHPEDLDAYLHVYLGAFETRKPFELEYRLRRRDGEYRNVLARGSPRFTPAGVFSGFCGLCLDITQIKKTEQEVRDREARFRTLTETVPQMVWSADPEGRMTFFNRRWDEYTGRPLAFDDWQSAVHPDDLEALRKGWRQAVAAEAVEYRAEFRLRRGADGAYRWMQAIGIPLRAAAGRVFEWVGSIADVDDRKRQAETLEQIVRDRTAALLEENEERRKVELQLRAMAEELRRSNQELEQFAYVASHDLQEPLRKIQAFGDRLRIKCADGLPDAGKDYLQRMHASAARMRRLIDDLLMFSRVTSQARPFVPVDLEELVGEVISDLDEYIEQSQGTVTVVPPLPTLDADPMQLRQLFQNLIANSIKFHRPDTSPVVRIAAEPVQDYVPESGGPVVPAYRITVTDNGIGFDEKYADRIFQMFQRLHGRDEFAGTGVGLAICRRIVERHGGTIVARSHVGEGSSFIMTLPLHPGGLPSSSAEGNAVKAFPDRKSRVAGAEFDGAGG